MKNSQNSTLGMGLQTIGKEFGCGTLCQLRGEMLACVSFRLLDYELLKLYAICFKL